MALEAQNASVYPQVHNIRTQFTSCENKNILSSLPKQGWNHEGIKQFNYHQLWWVLFHFPERYWIPFPGSQLPALLLRVKNSHHPDTDPVGQLSEWCIWPLKIVYWNVTGHKPSYLTILWWLYFSFTLISVVYRIK